MRSPAEAGGKKRVIPGTTSRSFMTVDSSVLKIWICGVQAASEEARPISADALGAPASGVSDALSTYASTAASGARSGAVE